MGNHWFVYKKQKQNGPYTWQQLWREAQAGRIKPNDLVWNKTMKDWIRASQVPGLINNVRKRNYLAVAVIASAVFFLALSGTAFYYLFFYTGPQLSALDEQEETEPIEEAGGDIELEDPDPFDLEEPAENNNGNVNRQQETAAANDPDDNSGDEPAQNGSGEQTISFQGGTYTGPLKDGEPHGYGVWTHPDGHRYEGDFRNGSIEGYGTMTFPGGERYTGYLKDGKAHGGGTMTHPDGRQVSGEWVEGVYQQEDANDDDSDDDNDVEENDNNNEDNDDETANDDGEDNGNES